MQWLADLITGALRWFLDLCTAVLHVLLLVFTDVACYLLENAGEAALAVIKAFDFSGITDYIGVAFDNVPIGVLNFAALVGFNYAASIISTALVVRLVLQLIPFVRLGS